MLDIDKAPWTFWSPKIWFRKWKVLSHDVPLVHTIVEEMVKRD